jgi:hypothetical protein
MLVMVWVEVEIKYEEFELFYDDDDDEVYLFVVDYHHHCH